MSCGGIDILSLCMKMRRSVRMRESSARKHETALEANVFHSVEIFLCFWEPMESGVDNLTTIH
jgi:hypothetical protein